MPQWSRTVAPKFNYLTSKGRTAVPGKGGWYSPSGELLIAMSTPPTINTTTASTVKVAYVGKSKQLRTGDKLLFFVEFDQSVTVTGSPQIAFSLNGNAKNATYSFGSGTAQLIFSYTIVGGDSATAGQVTITEPAKATHTFGAGNSAITITANANGTGGNSITVAFVNTAGSEALSVGVSGNAITVTLATDGSDVVTSTVDDVITAINNNTNANALVTASTAGDGTGLVAAATATALAGGVAGSSISLNSGTIKNTLGVSASHTFGSANAAVTFTSVVDGTSGNSLNVVLAVAGNSTPLSLSYNSGTKTLTVNLATNSGGTATSNVSDVISLVNNSNLVNGIFKVSTAGDGTGTVGSATSTALAGGTNTAVTLALPNIDLSQVAVN